MDTLILQYLQAMLVIYLSLFMIRYIVALQEIPTFLRLFRESAPKPFDAQPVKFALLLAAILLPLAFVGVVPLLLKRRWRFFEPMSEAELQLIVEDLVLGYESNR